MLTKISPTSQKNTSLLISIGLGLGIAIIILPIMLISIAMVVKNGEERLTEIEVSRVENIIQEEVNRTSRSLGDWANWTESYDFARGTNDDFVVNNMMDETFINLDIHQIVIINTKKEIVLNKFYNNEDPTLLDPPIDVSLLLNMYPDLVDMDTPAGLKGMAVIGGLPLVVTSNPILTSFNEGPPSGRMIFIKYLDDNSINKISALTLKEIDILPVDDLKNSPSILPPFSSNQDEIYAFPINTETILGYKYLKDLYGNPILILRVENSRDLNLQGRTTMVIISGILLLLVGLLCTIAYHFTKAVLSARERKKEEETAAKLLEETRQNAVELEKRVVERTRELEIRNKDLETFNYTVSHDLKSPLRGISGYATLLITDHASQLDDPGKAYLQKLVDAASQMNLLIMDLLSYTKTERTESKKTRVDIERLLDQLLLDRKDELAEKDINIVKKIECKQVMVDRDGINLALRNLLDNAIKFTQTNENPEIKINSKKIDGNCMISVTDNGIGFDMKYHDKIFAIFQRLHLPEEYPGTGIGLALVKKAMERLGGKVYAESEIGKGSTFHLEIPLE